MKTLLSSLFLLLTLFMNSQNTLNPVSWTATYISKTATEGDIVIKASIDAKWHIYSQRPTDAGPIPTSFTIVAVPANYELNGKVQEQDAHEEYVAAFDAKVFVFEKEALFIQKISRKNKKAFSVQVTLEFMTCNDKQCLPPKTETLTVYIPEYTQKGKL